MADWRQGADPVTVTGPSLEAVSQPITYSEPAAKDAAVQATTQDLSTPVKRDLASRGVNDPCSQQPDGYGPKPTPDTVAAFLAYQPLLYVS